MWRPLLAALALACAAPPAPAQQPAPTRPVVGLALGGGSARGLAHVGVIRWFEEHRVPIDRIAGTSMGGLVGGAYAAGMPSAELDSLLRRTDWNEMFGSSTYRYMAIPRKEDARAYPSRLELHLRGGVALPPSLNRGQQVDLFLERIAGLYTGLPSFDALPTPFRCVAVDLRSGSPVVLADGSLPTALRATMSLPGVFPPVRLGDRLLVDGGAMNNLPADVVRAMGADVVIAVRVGPAADTTVARYGMFAVGDRTVDAMMRANTRRAEASADIVVSAAVDGFGALDWRRSRALVEDGYRAAEARKAELLPYAVDEAAWRRYLAGRAAKRRTGAPVVTRLEVRGAVPADERAIRRRLRAHVGRPLDVPRLEGDITRLGGLDRYTAFGWEVAPMAGGSALVIVAHPLVTAPPLLLTSVNLRNRASGGSTFQLAARYVDYDVLARGAQLRVDLGLGTDHSAAAELRRGVGGTPFFVAVSAAAQRNRVELFRSDDAVAQYQETRAFAQLDVGLEAGHSAEVRLGLRGGYLDGRVRVGDPGLPELSGPAAELRLHGVHDTQNSAVVPSEGMRVVGTVRRVLAAPEPDVPGADRSAAGLVQAELAGSGFRSWRHGEQRVFVVAGAGTSFGGDPLPTDQFALGLPLRLDAFAPGERRGDHYAALTAGHLRAVTRLPDFLGGPVLAGGWLEAGSAFDVASRVELEVQVAAGLIAETLVGPVWAGYSLGPSARGFYVGVGRLFP